MGVRRHSRCSYGEPSETDVRNPDHEWSPRRSTSILSILGSPPHPLSRQPAESPTFDVLPEKNEHLSRKWARCDEPKGARTASAMNVGWSKFRACLQGQGCAY
jgi:hypothetical protein